MLGVGGGSIRALDVYPPCSVARPSCNGGQQDNLIVYAHPKVTSQRQSNQFIFLLNKTGVTV